MLLRGFPKKAASLISRLGRSVLIRSYTESGPSYNPTLTPSDTTATAVVFDFEASEVDGSIIQREDKEVLISANSVLSKTDKIVDDSKEYTIVNLEKVGPGDESFLYIAQVRL